MIERNPMLAIVLTSLARICGETEICEEIVLASMSHVLSGNDPVGFREGGIRGPAGRLPGR
jgi:hypothetical protein